MLFNSLLLIFLILIGGLATGIEAAMLSIDKIEIQRRSKNGDKRATRLLKIKENPTSFLATIQMCITLTSLLASAFAAETFASYFMRLLNVNADVEATLRNIIIIIITMVLSYVSLIFGELLPKKIGINKPEQVVYDSIGIIEYLMKAFRPFILFLTASTNFFMKLFRIKETPDEKFDEDKFKKLIIYSKHEGVINDEEAQVMLNMFEFGDIDIKSVMTPLKKVVSSEVNEEIKSIIKKVHQSKFTRIPIYERDSQNIIGILNIKDLIAKPKASLNNLMRKVVYVYETDKASIVFEEMKDKQLGMVVVKNDNHEVSGIVTMEDLIDEIIGNMFD